MIRWWSSRPNFNNRSYLNYVNDSGKIFFNFKRLKQETLIQRSNFFDNRKWKLLKTVSYLKTQYVNEPIGGIAA